MKSHKSIWGGALVEFAFALPLFLSLFSAVLFFSITFVTQQAVAYAAQQGAEAAVSVDPDAVQFNAIVRMQASKRIAGILSVFPGVDRDQPFALVFECPSPSDSGDLEQSNVSTICVVDDIADDGARRVVVSLAPRFPALLPGFPQPSFFVTPKFVRASGSAIVMEASGG